MACMMMLVGSDWNLPEVHNKSCRQAAGLIQVKENSATGTRSPHIEIANNITSPRQVRLLGSCRQRI